MILKAVPRVGWDPLLWMLNHCGDFESLVKISKMTEHAGNLFVFVFVFAFVFVFVLVFAFVHVLMFVQTSMYKQSTKNMFHDLISATK